MNMRTRITAILKDNSLRAFCCRLEALCRLSLNSDPLALRPFHLAKGHYFGCRCIDVHIFLKKVHIYIYTYVYTHTYTCVSPPGGNLISIPLAFGNRPFYGYLEFGDPRLSVSALRYIGGCLLLSAPLPASSSQQKLRMRLLRKRLYGRP